jgi:hypothetical protein
MAAGLNELNLSTGDEHQEWIPFDSVANAAYHAVKQGLLTLIVNEGKDTSRFKMEELMSHPLIDKILKSDEMRKHFILMNNIWMPFHTDTGITNNKTEDQVHYRGCDNIFENFVINPYGNLMSCCGLTMEYIPEMKVGNVDNSGKLQMTYANQYSDLLKLWIWLDGTRFIFDKALERSSIDIPLSSPHYCSICAQIYRDPRLRNIVIDMVKENAQQIVFRAAIKARITGRLPR